MTLLNTMTTAQQCRSMLDIQQMIDVCPPECTQLVCCNFRPNVNGGKTTQPLFSGKEKLQVTGCDIAIYRMSSIIIYREDRCVERRRKHYDN